MRAVPHYSNGPDSFTDEKLDVTRSEFPPYADDIAEKNFGSNSLNAEQGISKHSE